MKLKRLTLIFVLILFCLPWHAAQAQAQDSQTLMVFAAASLTDAFEYIASTFES
jgi:ABC-type molybdate transport system substrate-binding protein